MVIGFHLVWTAYGWWLPNDPRGSMSRAVVCEAIRALGPHHSGRKPIQPSSREIREFYSEARGVLKHELLTFNAAAIEALADSFENTIRTHAYTCYACALMPDHIHMIIRKHRHHAEEMLATLQSESRDHLRRLGLRSAEHPVWGGPGWKVFLETRRDVERTIRYIEENPVKIGRIVQQWPFVTSYDGWLPGQHPERAKR
jgi:REP element-mobilizing transposase RayT